jgi:pyruvate dehydrogenase E2 component (dihydrolipoamide acetyltransferase)
MEIRMPTEIYLVKAGMTMTEGMVEEWYVADGDTVAKGELLYRLETEKINLDVDAEISGVVRHKVGVGVTMAPGDVIGYIYAPGENIPAADTPASPTAPTATKPAAESARSAPPALRVAEPTRDGRILSSPAARRLARELDVDYTRLPGSGPGGRIVEADVRAARPAPAPKAVGTASTPVRASPLAKRIAAERGIDLARVSGTGPGGRITQADVEGAPVARTVPTPARQRDTQQIAARPGSTLPLKGMRKTIATRMHASLLQSAQLTMNMDVVMDDVVRLRAQLITEWEAEQVRPTYTDIVVRAVAKALAAHPLMNASFGETEIALHGEIHVGIAVAVTDGLLVPVIRHADRMTLKEISVAAAGFAAAARDGTLGLDDMSGGTFTVSALGMFGVDSFTPILNAPQAGILGVNRIRDDVAWVGDRPVKQQRMRLSLTWDHRVLDGAPAAQFLGAVRDLLEAPYRLLI